MTSLLAALPILLVVVLLLRGLPSRIVAPIGWLTALAMAWFGFGAGPQLLQVSQVRALFMALDVLYIVAGAILLAGLMESVGAYQSIGQRALASGILRYHVAILLAWPFASLIQGLTGYGIPVAVVAPLLVGLGLTPIQAVVASSLGHAWAITFGSVGSSMQAMLAVTGRSPQSLGPDSATLLGALAFLCGVAVAWSCQSLNRVPWRGRFIRTGSYSSLILFVGFPMALVQWVVASSAAWPLAAFAGAAAGLAVAYAWTVIEARYWPHDDPTSDARTRIEMPLWRALLPYGLLALVVGIKLGVPQAAILDRWTWQVGLPETQSVTGWINPAGESRGLSLLGHTGALILYAAIISAWIYRAAGELKPGDAKILTSRSLSRFAPAAWAILLFVGMSGLMQDSGMTAAIAQGISDLAGRSYGWFVPSVAGLGALVTGSNTASNILLADLQVEAAKLIGASPSWILAGQNAGAALGSVLSPAKVVVGLSALGMVGAEGKVLRALLAYAAIGMLLLGGMTAFVDGV